MQKYVVNKGKRGYDFSTLADTEEGAIDLAFENCGSDPDAENQRLILRKAGPFTWWYSMTKKWGEEKWYVVKPDISQAAEALNKGNI